MGIVTSRRKFCDFVGLRLFGESYLYAFSYLLSPNHAGQRPLTYPAMITRVNNLERASAKYGIKCPSGYASNFDDEAPPNLGESNAFRLLVADISLSLAIDELINTADADLKKNNVVLPSELEINRIASRFSLVVPAEGCKSLADIINAGWIAFLNPDLWKNVPQVLKKRDAIVKELTLKTIEVFQIEKIP
jgi:hypothetical protein